MLPAVGSMWACGKPLIRASVECLSQAVVQNCQYNYAHELKPGCKRAPAMWQPPGADNAVALPLNDSQLLTLSIRCVHGVGQFPIDMRCLQHNLTALAFAVLLGQGRSHDALDSAAVD